MITIPTWAVALLLPAFLGLVTWFIRAMVFDAIADLRKANIRQGKRIGRLETLLAVQTAVEEVKDELTAGRKA